MIVHVAFLWLNVSKMYLGLTFTDIFVNQGLSLLILFTLEANMISAGADDAEVFV